MVSNSEFRTFLTALSGIGFTAADDWARELNLATPRDIVEHEGCEFYVVRYADCRDGVDNGDLHLIAVQPFREPGAPLAVIDRRKCRVVG